MAERNDCLMKFIIDAQLPYRLKSWLQARGYDALHTLDLPAQNLSDDHSIAQFADLEKRVVISKDSDFLKLHILRQTPAQLLIITTGNINNQDLLALIERNFGTIQQLFEIYKVIELNNAFVMGHQFDDPVGS